MKNLDFVEERVGNGQVLAGPGILTWLVLGFNHINSVSENLPLLTTKKIMHNKVIICGNGAAYQVCGDDVYLYLISNSEKNVIFDSFEILQQYISGSSAHYLKSPQIDELEKKANATDGVHKFNLSSIFFRNNFQKEAEQAIVSLKFSAKQLAQGREKFVGQYNPEIALLLECIYGIDIYDKKLSTKDELKISLIDPQCIKSTLEADENKTIATYVILTSDLTVSILGYDPHLFVYICGNSNGVLRNECKTGGNPFLVCLPG